MRLDDEVYEYIKSEVIDLFERYDVHCFPISGFELAMKMGIVLVPYSSLSRQKHICAKQISPDGFYFEPGDGKEYIFYNDFFGYTRVNMTVLHEIAHAVLGHYEGIDFEVREAEAAFFAKYAAAPPPLVHRIYPNDTQEIMESFDISYEAAFYALEYYHKWRSHFYATGYLKAYEEKLLDLIPKRA